MTKTEKSSLAQLRREYELSGKELILPEGVRDFFGNKGIYAPVISRKAPKSQPPLTYNAVEGHDPIEVPTSYFRDESLLQSTEEFAIRNKDPQSHLRADHAAIRFFKTLEIPFGEHSRVTRAWMINTATGPIKVQLRSDARGRATVYVKEPDANRIIGRFLYDIISGRPIKWIFNEKVFAEEGIEANTLSRVNPKVYLQSPAYIEGAMRAAVHAQVLGLSYDAKSPRNQLIDGNHQTILFDFDQILTHRERPTDNPFLDGLLESVGSLEKAPLDAFFDEQRQVSERLDRNWDDITKFCRVVGVLEDLTSKSADERVKTYFGAPNLQTFLEDRMDEFSRV